MINLSPSLYTFINDDAAIMADATKVYTRRPVPENAVYPFIVVSSQVSHAENDFINNITRNITYDVIVYGQNDTSSNYRTTENIAFLVQNKFVRLTSTQMAIPAGYHLVQVNAIGPLAYPTDDNDKIARGISVNITISKD